MKPETIGPGPGEVIASEQTVEPKPTEVVQPVESVKPRTHKAKEPAGPVKVKPPKAEEPVDPVKPKPFKAPEASEPVKVKPPRATDPVKPKPLKAPESAEPAKVKPPKAQPESPTVKPLSAPAKVKQPESESPPAKPVEIAEAGEGQADRARPSRAAGPSGPVPQKSADRSAGTQRLGRPEFGQRLEFSASARRPPAPNSRRPAPPKVVRPAPRKASSPAPVVALDYDDAANVMLQAFELLRQVDAGALAELAEGVTGVEMKRAGREARRAPRLVCLYEVNCQIGTRRFPAVVSEISLTGVRLDLPESLARDTIVVLRPELQQSDLGAVRCSVRWCRRTPREGLTAGLSFQETPEHLSRSWVAQLLHSLGFGAGHQRRRSLRVQTRVPTEIISSGGEGVGKTVDLGIGGLQLQTTMRLDVGEEIDLMLGPTEGLQRVGFRGVVVNSRGTKSLTYGVRFEAPQPGQIRALGAYLLHCLGRNAED